MSVVPKCVRIFKMPNFSAVVRLIAGTTLIFTTCMFFRRSDIYRTWTLSFNDVTDPWHRVLRRFSDAKITRNTGPLRTVREILEGPPIICNSVVYTSHDGSGEYGALETYREAWSLLQDNGCYFRITTPQSKVLPSVRAAWSRRTRNNPYILTDRYRAALLLMSFLKLGKIRPSNGTKLEWILYVDGDTMIANRDKSVQSVIEDLEAAVLSPTMESRYCDGSKLNDCSMYVPHKTSSMDNVSLFMSLSPNCNLGYYSHSGALLFRPSPLTGFIFEVMADSAGSVIDTKSYRMGDQAIFDWLLERAFGVYWPRIRSICKEDKYSWLEPSCRGDELPLVARYRGVGDGDTHSLLMETAAKWNIRGENLEQDTVAFTCVRQFNSAGCSFPAPFRYECGDFLWHLFGCSKSSWRHGDLQAVLKKCEHLLPAPLPLARVKDK